MRLNNAHNAKASLATLIRKREKHGVEDDDYRQLVWGISQLLGYYKHVDDLRIEERLDRLEAMMESER